MRSRGTLTKSFKSLNGEVGNWYTQIKLSFFILPTAVDRTNWKFEHFGEP